MLEALGEWINELEAQEGGGWAKLKAIRILTNNYDLPLTDKGEIQPQLAKSDGRNDMRRLDVWYSMMASKVGIDLAALRDDTVSLKQHNKIIKSIWDAVPKKQLARAKKLLPLKTEQSYVFDVKKGTPMKSRVDFDALQAMDDAVDEDPTIKATWRNYRMEPPKFKVKGRKRIFIHPYSGDEYWTKDRRKEVNGLFAEESTIIDLIVENPYRHGGVTLENLRYGQRHDGIPSEWLSRKGEDAKRIDETWARMVRDLALNHAVITEEIAAKNKGKFFVNH
jgi:hypothetical protein